MTRISIDHRRSLKWVWTSRHRDVGNTSTSNEQCEYTGSDA